MKKYILFLILSYPLIFSSQEYNGNFTYSQVLQAEGKTAAEIRNSVREWISESYGDSQRVIDLDSETKTVIKSLLPINTVSQGYAMEMLYTTITTVSYKEGRFKVDLKLTGYKDPLDKTITVPLNEQEASYYQSYFKEDMTKDQFLSVTLDM